MTQIPKHGYDLEERTAKFGENVVLFCKDLLKNEITRPLISQIVRSGTSLGANYAEANNASSPRDFRNKIYIAKKECHETKHWLRMLATAVPEKKEEIRLLWQECHELTLIFQAITTKVKTS